MHVCFCYYAIKCQISTKRIGEIMFFPKTQHLPIVLPSKSRLIQLRIYTCTRRPVLSLVLRVIFQIKWLQCKSLSRKPFNFVDELIYKTKDSNA